MTAHVDAEAPEYLEDRLALKELLPKIRTHVENAKWAIHSHHYAPNWQGYEIGMCVALWGIHLDIVDPKPGLAYGYGWQSKQWMAYYPREFSLTSPIIEHRHKLEMWMGSLSLFEVKHKRKRRAARGLGRIGGDFWKVVRDDRGRLWGTLAGLYPESYWGQLNLNYCIPHILGKGKSGPVPTVRSEAFREAQQEVEARVLVEKAIVLPDRRAKLGEELATRCRGVLDDRIRMVNRGGGGIRQGRKAMKPAVPADWQAQSEALFRLASEVSAKLGRRTPDTPRIER